MLKYFLPICGLFFMSLVVSFEEKRFNFGNEVKFIEFYFMDILSKNFCLRQGQKYFFLCFILVFYVALIFIFHFELVFNRVWFTDRGSCFLIWTFNCCSTICWKKLSFLHWNFFATWLKINWLCVVLSLDSLLCSIDLHAYAFSNTTVLEWLYNRSKNQVR